MVKIIVLLIFALIAMTNFNISLLLMSNVPSVIQHLGFSALVTLFIMLFIGHSVVYRTTKISRGLPDTKEHLISSFVFPFLFTIPAASDLHTLTVLMPSAIATIFLIIFDQKICTFFNDHRHPYYSNIGRNGETSNAMFNTLRYQYWSMTLLLPIILVVAQNVWSSQ
ncbi:MAG: hypothetical protein ACI9E9_002090 [Reinekea sp.]|jgi:hypothetical protein